MLDHSKMGQFPWLMVELPLKTHLFTKSPLLSVQLIFNSLFLCLCLCLGFSSLIAQTIHWWLPKTKCVIGFQLLATVVFCLIEIHLIYFNPVSEEWGVQRKAAPGLDCSNLSRGGRLTAERRWSAARNCDCWELPPLSSRSPPPPLSCLSIHLSTEISQNRDTC